MASRFKYSRWDGSQVGFDLDADALIAHARERLSSYKVPSRIVFFQFDDIPRTASAKVQKGPLRELLLKRLGRAV